MVLLNLHLTTLPISPCRSHYLDTHLTSSHTCSVFPLILLVFFLFWFLINILLFFCTVKSLHLPLLPQIITNFFLKFIVELSHKHHTE